MSRKLHFNRFTVVAVNLSLLSFALIALANRLNATGPPATPERLVLRSESTYGLDDLSVDLKGHGSINLRSCEDPDRFRACKGAWATKDRKLSARELETLSKLARDAKLFDGSANGSEIDFAFRSLEVHARSSVAVLVTTFNKSFSESGPRKELLTKLIALEEELSKR